MTSDNSLERATLTLINMVAYSANSREHARRFCDATNVDLPTFDIRFLEYLGGRGAVPTTTVARDLGIDLSQASRQATQLLAAGFLQRETDEADRRRSLVSLMPSAAELLDTWVLAWASDYERPLDGWNESSIDRLAKWFEHVHASLDAALPGRPASTAPQRWAELAAPERTPARARFVEAVVRLVSWVGQSGGFNDLLEQHGAPIRQHEYLTLRVVSHHGPLSVAEVAERTSVERSHASKRLSRLSDLGLIDRATDGFDRRVNLVRASRKGRALVDRIHSMQLEDFTGILPALAPEDRSATTTLARRYVEGLVSSANTLSERRQPAKVT